jgi:hypothetical protein
MDNAQNCDSYINILLSQTHRCYEVPCLKLKCVKLEYLDVTVLRRGVGEVRVVEERAPAC